MDKTEWERQKTAALAKAAAEGKERYTILDFNPTPDDIIAAHGPMRDGDDSQTTLDL
jgi:hypothetical protein